MTWTIFLSIKILFGFLIFQLYKKLKHPSLDIQILEQTLLNMRKKTKWLFIIIIGLTILSVTVSKGYEKWYDSWEASQPFEKKIIGEWTSEDFETMDFDSDFTLMKNDTIFGKWSIENDGLTLELENKIDFCNIEKMTFKHMTLKRFFSNAVNWYKIDNN